MPTLTEKVKDYAQSLWYGASQEELHAWRKRGAALDAIRESEGYQLLMATVEQELKWARASLENCKDIREDGPDFQAYIKALLVVKNYVFTVDQNASNALQVIKEREKRKMTPEERFEQRMEFVKR